MPDDTAIDRAVRRLSGHGDGDSDGGNSGDGYGVGGDDVDATRGGAHLDRSGEFEPGELQTLYSVARSHRRRWLLYYLSRAPGRDHSIDETVGWLDSAEARADGIPARGRDRIESELHHVHIPKLSGIGAVTYRPDARTVTYHPDERLTAFLEAIAAIEAVPARTPEGA